MWGRAEFNLIVTVLAMGVLLWNTSVSQATETCIAVEMKWEGPVQYFKDGEVACYDGQYYCLFERFDGSRIRIAHSDIKSLQDVPITGEIRQRIDFHQAHRKNEQASIRQHIEAEFVPPIPRMKVPEPELIEIAKLIGPETPPPMSHIRNLSVKKQIFELEARADELMNQARKHMIRTALFQESWFAGRRTTFCPRPNMEWIRSTLEEAQALEDQAIQVEKDYIRKLPVFSGVNLIRNKIEQEKFENRLKARAERRYGTIRSRYLLDKLNNLLKEIEISHNLALMWEIRRNRLLEQSRGFYAAKADNKRKLKLQESDRLLKEADILAAPYAKKGS